MNIYRTQNRQAFENTYYIENDHHLLLVDPGSDWDRIHDTLHRLKKPISAILLTHTHYDHIMSLDLVREAFHQPPVYVAKEEASWLYLPEYNLSGLARHDDIADIVLQPAEHTFLYDQDYHLDGFHFQVRPTPGHSIGGVSIIFPENKWVLTGDALFCEQIGRTDLPTGNQQQLITSIKTELLTLPSDYRIYPGHGLDSTIGHEKHFNPFLQ